MQTLKHDLLSFSFSSYLGADKKITTVNTATVCRLCEQKCVKDGARILLDCQCQRPLKFRPPFPSDGWIMFLATLTFGVYEVHDRNQAGRLFHICNGRRCCEMWSLKTLQLSFMMNPFLGDLELGWTATQPNTRQVWSRRQLFETARGNLWNNIVIRVLQALHLLFLLLQGPGMPMGASMRCEKMQEILGKTIFGQKQGPHTSDSPYTLGMVQPTTPELHKPRV